MERRIFVKQLLVSGSVLGSSFSLNAESSPKNNSFDPGSPFNLSFAPQFGMFSHHAGKEIDHQLEFISLNGFRHIEIPDLKQRSLRDQINIKRLKKALKRFRIGFGTFLGHSINWNQPSLTKGQDEINHYFFEEIKSSVILANYLGSKYITVFPGRMILSQKYPKQLETVASFLSGVSNYLEGHGMIMLIKPVSPKLHLGQLIQTTSDAYRLCKIINSSSCKILYNVFNQQITEGSILESFNKFWDEIAYIQVADNPGRNEPNTGEINYLNIFSFLKEKGYKGFIGMDHGLSRSGKLGEENVIKAYREIDFMIGESY